MCRPLVTLTPEDDTVTTAWPRARCTPLIASLLQRSCRYEALVREETFTGLARKLERMLLKAYPLDIAVVSEDELRWRLRHIVRRLLKSKDCVALQPNNYAAS